MIEMTFFAFLIKEFVRDSFLFYSEIGVEATF